MKCAIQCGQTASSSMKKSNYLGDVGAPDGARDAATRASAVTRKPCRTRVHAQALVEAPVRHVVDGVTADKVGVAWDDAEATAFFQLHQSQPIERTTHIPASAIKVRLLALFENVIHHKHCALNEYSPGAPTDGGRDWPVNDQQLQACCAGSTFDWDVKVKNRKPGCPICEHLKKPGHSSNAKFLAYHIRE